MVRFFCPGQYSEQRINYLICHISAYEPKHFLNDQDTPSLPINLWFFNQMSAADIPRTKSNDILATRIVK
jgi:hypothetical protein